MSQLQMFDYNDTRKIAMAIKAGEVFGLKNGSTKYIATQIENTFPFSESTIDAALSKAANTKDYFSKEESKARLDKIK